MAYGTLSILDTIGARRAAATDYLHLYNEEDLYAQIQLYLNAHNKILSEMTADLLTTTTERFITWGSNDTVNFIKGDQYSRPDVQKISVSPTGMGLPLELYQAGWGVTRDFMLTKTVGDLEQVLTALTDGDIRNMLTEIRRVLFNPTNNTAYVDKRFDRASFSTTFPLRSFLNADGAYIPPDPYGNTFNGGSHTHFFGYASGAFAAADLQAGLDTVNEHYLNGNGLRIYIAKNLETTVRGFTGFYPYYDARLTLANTLTVAADKTLDLTNVQDRAIGVFDKGEVFVKPWVPSNYVFFFSTAAPKPLAMRTRPSGGMADLHIAADMETFPLRAQFMEREFGVSVVERSNGAALYTAANSYSAPATWAF